MPPKLKEPINPLLDAIGEIERRVTNLEKKDKNKIVDIITFCDSPEYLNLPGARFNLYVSQRVILKTFYMGTRGNEDLKLNEAEWAWLYSKKGPDKRGEMNFDRNIEQVIEKLHEKEKAQAQAKADGDNARYEMFNFRELLLVLGRRSSKCRSAKDIIATTVGSINFSELNERLNNNEKVGICTYDPKTLKRSTTYDIKSKNNGDVLCYSIETQRGIKETSSWNHPYYVWRDQWEVPRFVKMQDLKEGDRIAVANCTALFGEETVGVNKAALLGHFQGDGGTAHQVIYSSKCPTMLQDIKRIISEEYPDYEVVKVDDNNCDYRIVKKSRKKAQNGSQQNIIKEWLKNIDCLKVPECILKGSKEEVASFLSRIFGCDGWAFVASKTYKSHSVAQTYIGYSSSSKELIDGVRHLLLKFGIHCTISHFKQKLNGQHFDSWKIIISRKECLIKFAKEINIFSKEDKVRQVVNIAKTRSVSKGAFESVPIGVWNYVRKEINKKNLTVKNVVGEKQYKLGERLKFYYSPSQRKVLSYGNNIDNEFLDNIGNSDVKWDTIKSVKNEGKQETIALEVKGTNIIGGDIISHNTIMASVITTYEVYKLLVIGDGDPHKFYNLPQGDVISVINVALSQSQAGKLFEEIQNRITHSSFFEGRIAKETTTEIRVYTDTDLKRKEKGAVLSVNGSISILCGHSNPKTLLGKGAILLLFDEMAFFDEQGVVTGKVFYEKLKPSLLRFQPYGDGRIVEISSPNTEAGIFYDLYKQSSRFKGEGEEASGRNILSYQLPTWDVNDEISYEHPDLMQERSRTPETFAVEYGAQWARGGSYGPYFEEGLVQRCLRTDIEPHSRPQPGYNYYLHIDPANGGDRYVAVLVAKKIYADRTGKRRIKITLANTWVFNPVPGIGIMFNEIDKQIIQIASVFHPIAVSYDAFQSAHSVETLRGHGINCIMTPFGRGYKNKIYQNLKDLMSYSHEPELLLYEDGNGLLEEMINLRYRPTTRGVTIMADKNGTVRTDDLVDSLAGACAMAGDAVRMSLPEPVTVRMGYM